MREVLVFPHMKQIGGAGVTVTARYEDETRDDSYEED